jgi:uncharacterized protein (DUF4415 family)
MTTQAQRGARMHLMHDLERLQQDLSVDWLDKSLPDDWNGMEWEEPIGRHKTRVTLRLDADMVRWFRKLGPGYGPRINRVLRIYWMALLAGQIKAYPEDNTIPRLTAEARRIHEELIARRGG